MCLAIPGKVISIENSGDPLLRCGKVSFGGILKEVNLSMVPEAKINNYVLVHVGSAIATINEDEAKTVFNLLKENGDLAEEIGWE